jgi:Ca2+:H+ antiporter
MSHLPSPTSQSNADDGSGPYSASSTSTPTQGLPTPRAAAGISHSAGASAVSQWSAPDTPHHHAGTSYFAYGTSSNNNSTTALRPPVSPGAGGGSGAGTSRSARPGVGRSLSGSSARRAVRSSSVASSHGYSQSNSVLEEGEEDDDVDDELLSRSRTSTSRGKASAAATASASGADADADGDDEDEDDDDNGDDGGSDISTRDDEPLTLKERQSLINVEHPFGLPIWKPALYKKSRSVTRHADEALHSVPSAQAERHLLPGNIFWTALFGWWLAITFFAISAILYILPKGGRSYSNLIFGLGWYVAWPFGKYVEGDIIGARNREENYDDTTGDEQEGSHNGHTQSDHSTIRPGNHASHAASLSWNSSVIPSERTHLLSAQQPALLRAASKSYGTSTPPKEQSTIVEEETQEWLGKAIYWLFLVCTIAPLLLFVCLICWGLVITIPMARLNWQLIRYLFERPTTIRFCAAPPALVQAEPQDPETAEASANPHRPKFSVKHPRLAAGQAAPSSPTSTVLLCTYRAVGWKYYKYTVGGVNIMFINLMPVVFFVILDGMVLLRIAEHREHVPAFLAFLTSRALIFVLSLASVIPLSYFIGMAVASISAQSSIGMGAVINATFGSIIEVLLYSIALVDGKGRLVEGSIVGSLLAGILLMPGMSMVSSAMRRKEQKFNAKSAGVTSMMLIMAFIGTLSPTLFYQIYGNVRILFSYCLSLLEIVAQITAILYSFNSCVLGALIIRIRPRRHGFAIDATMSILIRSLIPSTNLP